MTPDKRVEKKRYPQEMRLMGSCPHCEAEINRSFVEATIDEILTQYHQDLMSEVEEKLEECNYEVDVDKVPSISDEAWANQYDSKAEAFWYGEREGLKALTKAQTIIKSLSK